MAAQHGQMTNQDRRIRWTRRHVLPIRPATAWRSSATGGTRPASRAPPCNSPTAWVNTCSATAPSRPPSPAAVWSSTARITGATAPPRGPRTNSASWGRTAGPSWSTTSTCSCPGSVTSSAGCRLSASGKVAAIRPDLPLYIAAGELDPVNANLALLNVLVDRYRAAGLTDVTVRTSPGARHEILNETNRDEVVARILDWIDQVLSKP